MRMNAAPPVEPRLAAASRALGLLAGSDKHVMDSRADARGLQLRMERVGRRDGAW